MIFFHYALHLPYFERLFLTVRTADTLFRRINNRGGVTFVFIFIILITALSYLAAFFITFNAGFGMGKQTQELSRAKELLSETLFEFQKQKALIAETQNQVFVSMEKISSIQYIMPRNVAFSSVSLGEN